MDQRMTADEASRSWRGMTIVVRLAFETDMTTGNCTLVLDLADGETAGSKAVSIRFDGVVGLTLKHFGGGLTQVLSLEVRDISDRQWDRQAYEVADQERDGISFRCQDYGVARQYTI
jgi:hypothetical protein